MNKIFLFLTSFFLMSCSGQENQPISKTENKMTIDKNNLKQITFGGGCFWCIESCFNMLNGVDSAISGYAGGFTQNPTYEEVTSGTTGHAEVVQISYDPKIISYDQLMEVFFYLHDPTQLNRQGNDVGTQYRSVIFYQNEEEKEKAEKAIAKVEQSGKYSGKVVTELAKFLKFWAAEQYHQGYYKANPNQPYCSAVVGPKIEKFRKHFGELEMLEN